MARLPASSLRMLFVLVLAYPLALVWGIRVRHACRIPSHGPAIIAANHNSHLDTLVLLWLFPLLRVSDVHPIAAADYFCRNRWIRWLSLHLIGIVPVVRGGDRAEHDPLESCYRALEAGKVLLVFPEGTRGEPEHMAEFKSGIWHLASRFPQVPVVPVFMHGLGKSMPKGSLIPIPFLVDVAVGLPLHGGADKATFLAALRERLARLQRHLHPAQPLEAL
jgi:1-acyl-sn-glycerol-3-phosphate acyltransferase